MIIGASGAIQFNSYGSGTHTGTSAYKLSVDSSGNIIETSIGSGAVDGAGTAGYIPKWTDGDTIGDSIIQDNGSMLTISGTGGDGTEILRIRGTASATFNWISSSLHANLTAAETSIHLFGKAEGTKKSGYIGYRYYADGSNMNLVTIGHYGSNYLVNIAGDGNVGIGITNPGAYKLNVQGDVYISGTLTEASSLGIKENIETYSPSLEKINRIRPVRYNKKKSEKKEVGLVAEELAEMFPELVERDEKGNPSGVNYSRAVAVLLHGFKELYKEVKELKEKI